MSGTDSLETVVIVNPNSGDGQHVEAVRDRARRRQYALRETEQAGDAVAYAREAAADGASAVVAAGGDGTVNEVVRGIDEADALDEVTFGVIPGGTGNSFAAHIGVTGIEDAFDVVANGERRRLDVGRTDDHLFVNSCVAGLTAESSGDTSDEMKERFGVLAYFVTTLRSVAEFDSLPLAIDVYEDGRETTTWAGDAMLVLVGNARRFVESGETPANAEDGLLDLTVVEDVGTLDLMGDAVAGKLFGSDSENIEQFRAPALEVTMRDPELTRFSLDGEIVQRQSLAMHADTRALEVAVGDGYEPAPEEP